LAERAVTDSANRGRILNAEAGTRGGVCRALAIFSGVWKHRKVPGIFADKDDSPG